MQINMTIKALQSQSFSRDASTVRVTEPDSSVLNSILSGWLVLYWIYMIFAELRGELWHFKAYHCDYKHITRTITTLTC